MSAIDDKHNELKTNGIDLGPALSPEADAAAGGRVREYQDGTIYWCSATGAHFVRGGIRALYLENGGPGINPTTGERDLGYPTTDEVFVEGTAVPHSRFEWGAIYWTPGTDGCVLHGARWSGPMGVPMTGNLPVAGGEAVYDWGGGVTFAGADHVLRGRLTAPPMGCPALIDPTDPAERRFGSLEWMNMQRADYDAVLAWRPTVFTELAQDRYALGLIGERRYVPLGPGDDREFQSTEFIKQRRVTFDALGGSTTELQDRTLYDLRFLLPNGAQIPLREHCFYTKSDWDNFGLLHVTDLHISGRNERFREMLNALGLTDGAENYSNFQDNLRDFIRYANKLHSMRLADAVVATGDLIDYVAEDGDSGGVDNYVRLHQLLLGQPFAPGEEPRTEELRLPIFVTRGNHDYRLEPYDLRADVDLPEIPLTNISWDRGINEHGSHNLIESEAVALQGGETPKYGILNSEEGARAIQVDTFDNKYGNFKRRFTPEGSYVVRLGRHRLVVMDTKYDAGIPADVDILDPTEGQQAPRGSR